MIVCKVIVVSAAYIKHTSAPSLLDDLILMCSVLEVLSGLLQLA
jgi:hypothetical protein